MGRASGFLCRLDNDNSVLDPERAQKREKGLDQDA